MKAHKFSSSISSNCKLKGEDEQLEQVDTMRYLLAISPSNPQVKDELKRPKNLPWVSSKGYLHNIPTVSEEIDPLCYCVKQGSKYPLLSGLVVDILSIPASSVQLNMCFLQLGNLL